VPGAQNTSHSARSSVTCASLPGSTHRASLPAERTANLFAAFWLSGVRGFSDAWEAAHSHSQPRHCASSEPGLPRGTGWAGGTLHGTVSQCSSGGGGATGGGAAGPNRRDQMCACAGSNGRVTPLVAAAGMRSRQGGTHQEEAHDGDAGREAEKERRH
jgi:hypothetical protein